MIKKIQFMLVLAVAVSGIPVHAVDMPSASSLWKNKTMVTIGVAGLVLSVLALLYAKKHRASRPSGSASAQRAAAPAGDAVGKSAGNRAIENATIQALETRLKILEEANAQQPAVAQLHQQIQTLQDDLREKASRITVNKMQGDFDGTAATVADLKEAFKGTDRRVETHKTTLLEEINKIHEEINTTNRDLGLAVAEFQTGKTDLVSLRSNIEDLGKRISEESAARYNLSGKLDDMRELVAAAQAQQQQGASAQHVRFASQDAIQLISPLASPRAQHGAGAGVDVSIEPAAGETPVAVVIAA